MANRFESESAARRAAHDASSASGPDDGAFKSIPRYVADTPLPSCAYVPGRTKRPADTPASRTPSPADWQACRPYLRGIDLFNHGYYWEAHESWEAVWVAAGRHGRTADFLKGLIKLTAAFVTARQGRAIGVARHARRAHELFRALAVDLDPPAVMMGLSLEQLLQEAARVADAPEVVVNTCDVPVLRVTHFVMRLDTGVSPH